MVSFRLPTWLVVLSSEANWRKPALNCVNMPGICIRITHGSPINWWQSGLEIRKLLNIWYKEAKTAVCYSSRSNWDGVCKHTKSKALSLISLAAYQTKITNYNNSKYCNQYTKADNDVTPCRPTSACSALALNLKALCHMLCFSTLSCSGPISHGAVLLFGFC